MKFFQMAHELNLVNHEKLKEKELHFRGSMHSFSLISLARETAEVGLKNLKSLKEGENALNNKIASKLSKSLGRSTPEKVLQAWIIKHAINNEMLLPFGKNLTFLTSELAFKSVFVKSKGKNGKLVNDLLAIDDNGSLWIIELKSERHKKRLADQVNDFIAVIDKSRDFFVDLVTTISDKKWNGTLHGMVVWPYAKTSPLNWGEIVEICYDSEFIFSEI